MIELRNIAKTYGSYTALHQLNLSVPAGEVFGFIGPNGAGKTTTIKIIGGILAPTEGTVRIAGIDMARDPVAAKQRIGFIPDRPYLYEKLTGMEFLQFTADVYGVSHVVFQEKAVTLLEMFALADWGEELIESYSHGMKQRLIMCAALLHDPEVLVVDEPMVGLDPVAIRMVKNLFRDLARKGVAVFMSTHTLAVAEDICDRIGIIHRGRLIAEGTLDDLRKDIKGGAPDLESVFINLTQAPDNPGEALAS
ncbi:MAG: ABC transporter ATP-binding protein [Desulfobacteraceae bacterium]|nr:ABC transporter ATP-binding protein [Desulfobacteraceae bacterium]MBC2751449.1 ABC transporter ATP-binding protein [Desulfobacteraceae bacterium]